MLVGISIDSNQICQSYNLVGENLDVIKHIQFYLNAESFTKQRNAIIDFQNYFCNAKLTYSIHAYGYINLCETIDIVRERWVDFAIQTIKLAYITSCKFVNYHMGYTFSKSINRKELLAKLYYSLIPMVKYAQKKSVDINLENDFNTVEVERLGSRIDDLEVIIDSGYPHTHICYDIGHANIAFSSPYEYRRYINYIQSFHIHNNYGVEDIHNPFGIKGTINLDEVLSDLFPYNNLYFILENDIDEYITALTNIRKSLKNLRKPSVKK